MRQYLDHRHRVLAVLHVRELNKEEALENWFYFVALLVAVLVAVLVTVLVSVFVAALVVVLGVVLVVVSVTKMAVLTFSRLFGKYV